MIAFATVKLKARKGIHMQTSITASLSYSFKGEVFQYSSEINLIDWVDRHQGDITYIYDLLAQQNGLDRYRHEYDVMVMEPIIFSNAIGLGKEFLHADNFDTAAFTIALQQSRAKQCLQRIAKKHLDIDCLEEHPNLEAALLEAYQTKS